jgi:hypothetical protein|tara:strand:- start:794 stop:1099 length:306 start_codon:yes stop_codon:yes gene_type:complete
MSEKQIKKLRKKIKPLQVEWLKTLLPAEQSDSITIENVDELLPDQTHVFGGGTMYLSYMSDKWVMKMLKKYPHIKTYSDLETIQLQKQTQINQGKDVWASM